ncbi:carbohydrate binding domain-containing protein [Ruminococcus flavefaciens]|uniref:Glucuronoarabinoxylan endo-1,4-beta-xylanase n=1 Tax=Ruminococcus flavefaciens TaxID=1265 RepID=A0A315XUY3_RUMFL|nr:carbohydrate binding domain-containing protein [Ruminococcus flavefaciens]PWJ10242.1 glucuronoarabinoxylan endo-1,4-beta-xylanase [Ruminococcus flavefaciens]SSA51982.1 glucuronoarabinoxylan endo-1,4-beta-xylanase [Ruminococcus flavefaciens]
MKIVKTAKAVVSAVISGLIIAASVPAAPCFTADAASLCTINTSKTYQTIRGFGGINLPEWVGSDMSSAQVQKAFGNGDDELGLTILRIYVSDDSNSWSRAVPTALAAQKLGATVFATPWNPPASMRNTVNGGVAGGKYQLRKDKWADYAKHLNSYVKFMESKGVNLYSVSVQNEPDYAADWTYWSASDLASFIAQYGKQVTSGTKAKLMSPESFQYRKDIYNAILNNSAAYNNTDLFGTHFYGTQRSQMDFPALENSGKEIWMTEVYVPNSEANSNERWPEAIKVSENIHNGLVVGNLNAYVWWYIRRNYSPMNENGTISKRGYCMAQFSKFVRPGDVRVDATEQPATNVLVSAYKNNKNQVTIVAVNNSDEGYAQQFSVGKNISDVDRWRTTSNENLAKTENLEYSGDSFWAQLPARSVSTFVVTLEGGSGNDQPSEPVTPPINTDPDENGYYFHDTFEGDTFSWEGHGAAEATLSGRTPYKDAEALLSQNREKAWNGLQKSLSTDVFKPGSEYSFSVCAEYLEGSTPTQEFVLSLQYADSAGETQFAHIAQATALKGQYVQLANTNFKIPEGASDLLLYVETTEGTGNFYIDEAIGAVSGTKVDGPSPVTFVLGDINCDGSVDSFDVIAARRGLISGTFSSNIASLAADVDMSGEYNVTDTLLIQQYTLGKITVFPDNRS